MAPKSRDSSFIATVGLFIAPILYHLFMKPTLSKHKHLEQKKDAISNKLESFYRTPFPPIIRAMLSTCRLAYMSTVDSDASSSHLSLMRFTYLKDEDDGEVVVLSTQRRTKKYDMLNSQKGVALLIHDFPQFGEEGHGDGDVSTSVQGVHSITLNGQCQILEDGEKAEKYRAAHLKHNPDYPQFIVGDDIAILLIFVTSARICNIDDQVTKWTAS